MDPLTADDPVQLGPYRLLGRLGAGGMGQVYLARPPGGRTVAVKLVRREFAARPEFRRRFTQEVAAARRVGGAWTAPVLDADTEAAVPWLATGYVPGPSLSSVVDAYGPLPEFSVRVLAHRLARALEAIHTAGLIHRDLKPSNVLLTVDGPRVIDFGIARALDTVVDAVDAVRTQTGVVVGSPGFMSPEQVRAQRVTAASDVFCLGSLLAFAVTGRTPFGDTAGELHALLYRIAEEEPDLTGLPAGLTDVIRDCLRKDPAARPTPQEIARRTALATAPAGSAAAAREEQPWLPGPLLAELGRQAAQLLDTDGAPVPPREPAAPPTPTGPPHAPTMSAVGSPPSPPSAPPYAPPSDPGTMSLGSHGPRLHTTAPNAASGTRGAPRRGLRAALLGGGGVVVAAVCAVLVVNLLDGPGDGDGKDAGKSPQNGGVTSSRSATPSEETGKADVLPAGFAGTWEGDVSGTPQQDVRYMRLTLTGGTAPHETTDGTDDETADETADGIADEIADGIAHRTGTLGQAAAEPPTARLLLNTPDELCEAEAEHHAHTADRLVLAPLQVTRIHPSDGPDGPCALADQQTITLTKKGLHWVSGGLSADLTRANTGERAVPTAYVGTWHPVRPQGAGADLSGLRTVVPWPAGADGTGGAPTITITQGPFGTAVARSTATVHGRHCTWHEILFAVDNGNALFMGPYEVDPDTSDDGCRSGGTTHVYAPEDDGTLLFGGPDAKPEQMGHLKRAD
ncbi:serine/threonine-protein kinase [Streptomyces odontomachi]|uniref:serine/threonine-protein kinase n=1 Tax=Streptomyces odontomachi TaxID=2944940 RepID=UPI002108BB2F|nr:serine/threonine-protein kinase [Streptomyces sp. ODS25]